MPLIRYDGPGRVLHAFGRILQRGQEDEFTEQETRQLLAQTTIHVTVEAPPADIDVEIEELHAAPSGVGEPEAQTGEGHHTVQ